MTVDIMKLVKEALAGELEQLRDAVKTTAQPLSEEQFWRRPIEPGNSFGHLVLHLPGNLNYMVGACLGGTGYTRDPGRDITEQNVPAKAEALAKLDAAVAMFRRVVEGLGDE